MAYINKVISHCNNISKTAGPKMTSLPDFEGPQPPFQAFHNTLSPNGILKIPVRSWNVIKEMNLPPDFLEAPMKSPLRFFRDPLSLLSGRRTKNPRSVL